ncbi:MAG TPA: hypothetical protein VFH51_16160, partial [Myxococcota bacterium]|nr:hypothetical protein [Myxococcota bacterium]
MSGRGLLTTRDRRLGPLTVKALALEIPDIAFPFDVSGGAERFKPRRCVLRHLALSLDTAGLEAILAAGALEENGLTHVKAVIHDGYIELAGLWHVGEARADFTCRAALLSSAPHELQVVFYDTRVWGWLPLPAALLPMYLRRALAFVPVHGNRAGIWILRPGESFVREVLPRAGWKIPSLQGAHLVAAEVARNQISLGVGRADEPSHKQLAERSPPTAAVRAAEGVAAFSVAEDALARGEVRVAYQHLREAVDEGRGGPWARERLLQIGASDPELALETHALAGEILAEHPGDIAATLALAAMAVREGELAAAAEHYTALATVMRERKERLDAVAADLAAGSAAATVDPRAALAAYERAATRAHDSPLVQGRIFELRRQTGDARGAAEAGERWVGQLTESVEAAAAHVQVGLLYLRDLKDAKRARLHFERALRCVPDAPAALEGLAETYVARGEAARAATYLARLAEQAEASGDRERIVSLNLRLAEIWQTWLHDPESASARLFRVLDVAPRHRQARLMLARLAEARGDSHRARGLYQDVIASEEAEDVIAPEALPDVALAHTRLGHVLLGTGAMTQAAEHLGRALELQPANREARTTLVGLLRKGGEWARLVRVLESVAATASDPEEVRLARLEAARLELQERQNKRAARIHLAAVLQAHPADPEALSLLLPMLESQNDNAALAEALQAAAEATADGPGRAELLYRLAVTQMGLRVDSARR